jgi:hypothetical protein
MTVNRGFIFWGLALVTAGAVALAVQLGYIDRGALAGAWRLWPLVLIAIGLSIILARTGLAILGTIAAALVIGFAAGAVIVVGPGNVACAGSEPAQLTERHGTFSGPAAVTLHFDCGRLDLSMSERQAWRVSSGTDGPATIQADAASLTVSRQGGQWWNAGRQKWAVTLPRQTSSSLEVEADAASTNLDLLGGQFRKLIVHPNAGSLRMNLTGSTVDDLNLQMNAGSASIIVGRGADVTGSLQVNAGSIELCTGSAVALSITLHSNITFSHNLGETGLEKNGNTWTSSPPSVQGSSVLMLTIEGNAGSFALNPEGGCA